MLFARHSNPYAPLPLNGRRLDHGESESSQDSIPLSTPYVHDDDEKPYGTSRSRTVPWTLVVILACTLLNVALTLGFLPTHRNDRDRHPNTHAPLITRQNLHLLRRPDQYIGFDTIPRPSPPVARQLSTYPILLSLVDAAFPGRVYEDDFAARMVHTGTVTPDDRRVRVTSTMSTIVQFRAIDWGMEMCELHVDLPESYGQPGHPGALALYRLNASIPLDSAALSYSTRPARIAKLDHMALGAGEIRWHRRFSCATDDVLSFELACLPASETGGEGGCEVEWVQIKDTLPAIHMVQHATK